MNLYLVENQDLCLSLDSTPDIKVLGTFREYYDLLNKRLKYLHILHLNFKSKRLAMINKDRTFFQYNNRDLVYIISPLTSQLCTASRKITIKYVGPVVIYKVICCAVVICCICLSSTPPLFITINFAYKS